MKLPTSKSFLGLMLGIILCFGANQEALAEGKKEPKNEVPVSGSRFSSGTYDEVFPKEIITGAFGLKLGKRLDPSIVISENKKENTAKVKPIIPNKMFNDYSVTFTPKTKTIVAIWASITGKKKCPTDEFRGLKVLFNKKFNKPVEEIPLMALYRWHGSNGREVEILCLRDVTVNNLFRVTYREKYSSRKGMTTLEQMQLDLKSIDSSGL
jgi:hypothetical protein